VIKSEKNDGLKRNAYFFKKKLNSENSKKTITK
jgi:hypothetical protein